MAGDSRSSRVGRASRVTGADRQTFLHNFCTNDVRNGSRPGRCCEAFFTNVKGKILAHGLVSCRESELVVVTVPGQAAPLVEHLATDT